VSETAETFTCARCGETHDKGWSDAEAAAEAQENFPGIDITDPDEAGVVCDDCYKYLMGRARAEAPELIGPGWRGSDDPIGDALRADAEEARGQIRSAGLTCPSCGGNAGDLYGRHCLVLVTRTPVSGGRGFGHPVPLMGKPETWCECRGGQPVNLADADWETWKGAANIALMDDFWFRENIAFNRMVFGTGPGKYAGLLGALGGEDR